MFVAIVIGLAVGVAAFAPLIFGMNKARMASPTSNLGHAGSLLLGVLLPTMPLILKWYCRVRTLENIEKTAIMVAFYCCVLL